MIFKRLKSTVCNVNFAVLIYSAIKRNKQDDIKACQRQTDINIHECRSRKTKLAKYHDKTEHQ